MALVAMLLLGIYCASSVLAAPAGRIVGKVTDAKTGEALPGANVRIEGTSIGAATDFDGNYTIPSAPSGSHTLIVSYVGYETAQRQVTIPDGGSLTVDFQLQWEGVSGEEVVITAQAEGQTAAINQQLASNTITNIVSAARIQELPDVNAAESIGRLPGVAIQRSGGEANKVSIRGLSPKYNTVTVNGVRVPATGGDDRSVDLALISSNMLSGIEVKKAITPDMDADVLGGSVDLKLREAPSKLMIDFLGQGGYNQLQDYYGNYKFAGSMSNRFFGNRLGLIGSFNLDQYDRSADKYSGSHALTETGTGEYTTWITSETYREENVTRDRVGGSVVADFRIPAGKIVGNTFYNRLGSDGLNRVNDLNASGGRHYFDLYKNKNATSILTAALGLEQDFNWIRYDAGVSRTSSRAEDPENFEWQFGIDGGAFTKAPDITTNPGDMASWVKLDSSTVGLQGIWVRGIKRDENVSTAQLNVTMPFRMGNTITGYVKTGGRLRWLDRMNDESQMGRFGLQYGSGAGNLNDPLECVAAELPDWNLDEIVGREGVLPMSLALDSYRRTDVLDRFDLQYVPNETKMMQITRALQKCPEQYRNNAIGSRGRDYDGIERYQAGYVMAEINLGRHITLIPGVRFEGDYSRYHGQRYREVITAWEDQEPANLEAITNIRKNNFWLPMVHLQLKPTDWLTFRLARTETLTRPDYMQYAPITTINTWMSYVRAANGLLRPAHSTNYDAAMSIYRNRLGLFTVAGFSKSVDDLIQYAEYRLHPDLKLDKLFPGQNLLPEWVPYMPTVGTYINNPHPAEYRGVEFDWQTNFWYLPSVFKGLVLNVNYTYVQSEMKYQRYFLLPTDSLKQRRPPVYWQYLKTDSLRTGRVEGQPSHIANVTLGYDYKGFSTRLSYLYQTNVATSINVTSPVLDAFSGQYERWDLSVSQKLRGGMEMFANFNNLGNRKDQNFRQSPNQTNRPSYLEQYGFTMDLGARYRF